jgi:hypothetical protein
MKKIIKTILFCLPAILMLLYFSDNVSAIIMSSANYRIQADDSLTPAGGNSSSVNYSFRDTMGEFSTGPSVSTSGMYDVRAGYQEMLETYISISPPPTITLLPNIPGITGGTADASATWNVITDSPSGFNMQIKTTNSPNAMLFNGNDVSHYFANYPTTPTYNWNTPATASAWFGLTPEPQRTPVDDSADTVHAFLDNGSNTCGTGSTNGINTCWAGFNGAANTSIINRTVRTAVAGENYLIRFRAQSNHEFLQQGIYTAIVTVTVYQN